MSTTSVLSIRLSDEERRFLQAAAESAGTRLSDFVRRKAIEAAELEMLKRRGVVIPAKDWKAFEAWVRSPPKSLPGLKKLLRTKPTWER